MSVSVTGMRAENIADFIGVNRFQAELAKLVRQPLGPDTFAKRRRRNTRQLQLPVRKLRLLGAKPGKSAANFGQRTKMRHFLLRSRKRLRDFGLRAGHGQDSVVGLQSLAIGRWSLVVALLHEVFFGFSNDDTAFSC